MTNKHNKNLTIKFVVASTLAISTTVVMSARANELRCYMQTSDGKLVDLNKLCDRKSSPSPTPQASGAENPAAATGNAQMTINSSDTPNVGKIDPNAPVKVPLVIRDNPSELWNTLPDLPSPPVKGPTTSQ